MKKIADEGGTPLERGAELAVFLASAASDGITGRLLSAVWDPWSDAAGPPRRTGQDGHLHAAAHRAGRSRPGLGQAMSLGVGIVGCGLIGGKRAAALAGARLVACADVDPRRAEALAQSHAGARAAASWQDAAAGPAVDVVIVATSNDALASVSAAALEAGKHVLVEKPAARTVAELDRMAARGARRRSGWSASASTIAIIRRCSRRAAIVDAGAHRAADVPPRPLRPWRTRRLRP